MKPNAKPIKGPDRSLNLLLPKAAGVRVIISRDPGISTKLPKLLYDRLFAKILASFSKAPTIAELHLVKSPSMTVLNKRFRQQNKTTDVLSFSTNTPGLLGSIVIDIETARKQARDFHQSLEGEIQDLFIHGALHLLGLDHQTKKEAKNMSQYEKYFGSLLDQLPFAQTRRISHP